MYSRVVIGIQHLYNEEASLQVKIIVTFLLQRAENLQIHHFILSWLLLDQTMTQETNSRCQRPRLWSWERTHIARPSSQTQNRMCVMRRMALFESSSRNYATGNAPRNGVSCTPLQQCQHVVSATTLNGVIVCACIHVCLYVSGHIHIYEHGPYSVPVNESDSTILCCCGNYL